MRSVLAGRTIVVTGATSGIGASLAQRLCADGASVVGVGRRTAALAAIEAAVRQSDVGRFVPVEANLADPDARAGAIAQILAATDRVDALVNNAGEAAYQSPTDLGADGWRALFELNVHAPVALALGLAPRMSAGAHIVMVSSMVARHAPSAKFAGYAATKAALERATDALRLDLDPRGIRVTTIAPGLVDTPLYAGFPELKARLDKSVPKWLSAGDIAETVQWVLSRPTHVVIGELTIMPAGQGR